MIFFTLLYFQCVQKLQESLLSVTLQQGYMGEEIPQVWLNFEKRILIERQAKVCGAFLFIALVHLPSLWPIFIAISSNVLNKM